jgi:hypothetical protein
MSEPTKMIQDEKLMDAIENYVWSMKTQTLREWINNELTAFYFGNTVDQEIIDDFIEENKPDE